MRSRSLRLAAVAATALSGVIALGPVGPIAHAAGRPVHRLHLHRVHRPLAHFYRGYLTAAPSSTSAPATLTIQTPHVGLVTVTVEPSTVIVRRYNGPSGLDELSVNDVLEVRGTPTGPGAVTATHIRDVSIQVAFTRLVGQVTAVAPNSVSVVVQRDRVRAPFPVGANETLPVGPSTQVISGTTVTTGTTAGIAVGNRVIALGIFNRASNTFSSTFRIRVLPAQASHPVRVVYRGYLTTAPMTVTAPTTLTLQTAHAGTVAVLVDPSTVIVRRYNGPSSLDELSANDVLEVRGTLTASGMMTATHIRDISIQAAFTRLVGQVTAVTPNSVSVVVQRDLYGRAPFPVGANETLPVGPSTQVISGTTVTTGSTSGIAVGNRITALGVFNRASSSFISTFRIRIL